VLTIIDHSACLKVYMRVIIRPRDSRVYTETTECNMLEASTVLGWRQLRKGIHWMELHRIADLQENVQIKEEF